MIGVQKDGNISREQVWVSAWCACTTASNCSSKEVAANWADACLRDFDKRFPRDAATKDSAHED